MSTKKRDLAMKMVAGAGSMGKGCGKGGSGASAIKLAIAGNEVMRKMAGLAPMVGLAPKVVKLGGPILSGAVGAAEIGYNWYKARKEAEASARAGTNPQELKAGLSRIPGQKTVSTIKGRTPDEKGVEIEERPGGKKRETVRRIVRATTERGTESPTKMSDITDETFNPVNWATFPKRGKKPGKSESKGR